MTALEIAIKYSRRGWSVVPIPSRSKNPGLRNWAQLRLKEENLPAHFGNEPRNIGVLLGEPSAWLIDVDLDHRRCVQLADEFLPPTPAVFGRAGKPRSHRLYRVSAPVATKKHRSRSAGMLVELRSTGAQTVFPPSIHESGETILWEDETAEPAVVEPTELLSAVVRLADTVRIELGEKAAQLPKADASAQQRKTGGPRDGTAACIRAMSRMSIQDANDGSARLFACTCRVVEHDLIDADGIIAIREYARQQPFPKDWSDSEIVARIRDAEQKVQRGVIRHRPLPTRNDEPELPRVRLPGGPVRVRDAAREFGKLLGATGTYYARGGALARVSSDADRHHELAVLRPAHMPAVFEEVAQTVRLECRKDGFVESSCTANEQQCKLILHTREFFVALPEIRSLSDCPVLVERNAGLLQICGFDRESGIYADGQAVPKMELGEAKTLLDELLAGFQFVSPSARSRAMAALIAPALHAGGLLKGRLPVDLLEADASQAGKGFFVRLRCAVYRSEPTVIHQHSGRGVGSFEEQLAEALISGRPFLSIDNVRGRLDSQMLESMLTESSCLARTPYGTNVRVDPRRFVVAMTSNKAEVTIDLSNRSSLIGIRKQPHGFRFAEYPEGDVFEHVQAHQPRFLAAVFAVCREWHRLGKPRLTTADHDFRPWARTLGWMVEHLLGEAPLLESHRSEQRRISTPGLTWLRAVMLAVSDSGLAGRWLRAHHLIDVLHERDVEVPGVSTRDIQDEDVRTTAMMAIGRRLAVCFDHAESITVDAFRVDRRSVQDDEGRSRQEFIFYLQASQTAPQFAEVTPQCPPRSFGHFPRFPAIPAANPTTPSPSGIDPHRDDVGSLDKKSGSLGNSSATSSDRAERTHSESRYDGVGIVGNVAGIAGNRGKTTFPRGATFEDRGVTVEMPSSSPYPEGGCLVGEEPPDDLLHSRLDRGWGETDGDGWEAL